METQNYCISLAHSGLQAIQDGYKLHSTAKFWHFGLEIAAQLHLGTFHERHTAT